MTPPTQLKNCLRPLSIFSKDLLILLLVVSSLGSPLRGQQGGGVAPSGPQVHLIRFVVGAKGEQRDGSFVMTEPRSVSISLKINSVGSDTSTDISEAAYYSTGGTSVAASLLPQSVGSAPTSLKDLWAKGEMMPVVSDTRYVLFGMLIQGAKDGSKKRAPVPGERELKVAFRKGDTSANAIIHFNAPENVKSRSVIKLYDVDNRSVGTGKVEKLNLSRGESLERSWQLPLSTLTPGIYRVDILIGDSVAWRQYFKLTD
jgi:hypothetical protein